MNDSDSPTGLYRIVISPWEVRMSLWIESPAIIETETGTTLLAFRDSHWSLDSADWRSDSVVVLSLRKYPGNHEPPGVNAIVDCAAGTAEVADSVIPLAQLERALDRSLTWVNLSPARPRGWRGIVHRLFGR